MDINEYNKFVDSFIKEKYSISKLDRNILTTTSNNSINSSSSSSSIRTIKSYGLSSDDLKLKTNIAKWAVTKFHQPIDIKPFPIHELESILILEAPKKIISYYHPTDSNNVSVIRQNPPKSKTSRGPRPNVLNKLPKRSMPEIASLYADERELPSNKKYKSDDYIYDEKDKDKDKQKDRDRDDEEYESAYPDTRTYEARGPPPGLYPAINNIRDLFWDLEYEPQSVSFAFFALINAKNCHEFELKEFAQESCSLTVINDRIRNSYYNNAEEFESDFRQMFKNIMIYYPRTHPAYTKAIELSQLFESKWSAIKSQIK